MIYINNESNSIQIPSYLWGKSPKLLRIEQIVGGIVKEFANPTDTSTNSLFYKFEGLSFDGLQDGEYNFVLFDAEDCIISSGLLIFGNYVRASKQYQNENKIKTYER